MPNLEAMKARVRRRHPGMDEEEVDEIARDWCEEAAMEAQERDDTACIEDTMPEEVLALRRELRDADRVDGYDRDDLGESPDY